MNKYIDADELKEKIAQQKLLSREPATKRIVEIINSLPSTDVENRGEWIEDCYGYNHCSKCGYEMDHMEEVTPFCPHCGANMEVSE